MIFERAIHTAESTAAFWRGHLQIADINLNTIEIINAWKPLCEQILSILKSKVANPLEKIDLPVDIKEKVAIYEDFRLKVEDFSKNLEIYNEQITHIKNMASSGNLMKLQEKEKELQLHQKRHNPEVSLLCKEYSAKLEEEEKLKREQERINTKLTTYSNSIFTTYQEAINVYLKKFLADFHLDEMNTKNHSSGKLWFYNVIIRNNSVPINDKDNVHSFSNTLSAGDRNSLALAFFFALLDNEPNHNQKIVILDDPMTSLDEDRTSRTINHIVELIDKVKQIIILSHNKSFLCKLWEKAGRNMSTFQIVRSGEYSDIQPWDISQAIKTEHEKNCNLIVEYIEKPDSTKKKDVAATIRLVLEQYLCTAYSSEPIKTLGKFINHCENVLKSKDKILEQCDIKELKGLNEFANQAHHANHEEISDSELLDFCKRTIAFCRRPITLSSNRS